eukprot:scaffold46068_cov68-Phaeocystis_antarctica.AAC.3
MSLARLLLLLVFPSRGAARIKATSTRPRRAAPVSARVCGSAVRATARAARGTAEDARTASAAAAAATAAAAAATRGLVLSLS